MFGEVFHELFVDEGVEELGDDWEEGDGSVEFGEGSVFFLEEFDDFCQFERVWVFMFVDGLVEELCKDGC